MANFALTAFTPTGNFALVELGSAGPVTAQLVNTPAIDEDIVGGALGVVVEGGTTPVGRTRAATWQVAQLPGLTAVGRSRSATWNTLALGVPATLRQAAVLQIPQTWPAQQRGEWLDRGVGAHDAAAYAGTSGDATGYAGAEAAAEAPDGTATGVRLTPGNYGRDANLTYGKPTVPVEIAPGVLLAPPAGRTYTVHAPRAGRFQWIDPAAAGTVRIVGLERIPVEWFGAKPDGATDCAPAFQRALGSVLGGCVITMAEGSFRLASTVTISKQGLGIAGASAVASVLFPDAGVDAFTLSLPDVGYVGDAEWRDFAVVGGRRAVYIVDQNPTTLTASVGSQSFTRLYFSGQTEACFEAKNYQVLYTTFDRVMFATAASGGGSYGCRLTTTANVINFRGCRFRNAAIAGCAIDGSHPRFANGVKFSQCAFEANRGDGTRLNDARGIEFEQCWWEDNARSNIGAPHYNVRLTGTSTTSGVTMFRECQLGVQVGGNYLAASGAYMSVRVVGAGVYGPLIFDHCAWEGTLASGLDVGAAQGFGQSAIMRFLGTSRPTIVGVPPGSYDLLDDGVATHLTVDGRLRGRRVRVGWQFAGDPNAPDVQVGEDGTGVYRPASGHLSVAVQGTGDVANFSAPTDGEASVWLLVKKPGLAASVQRVKIGAAGSGPGGVGRALYID